MPDESGDEIDRFPDAYSLGKGEEALIEFLDAGGEVEELPRWPPAQKSEGASG